MDKRLEEFHETTGGTDPDFDKLYDFLKLQVYEIKKLKEENKKLKENINYFHDLFFLDKKDNTLYVNVEHISEGESVEFLQKYRKHIK